jgi:hypothetical protein
MATRAYVVRLDSAVSRRSLRNFVGAKAALDIHRPNRKRMLHSAGSPRTVRLVVQSFQRLFPVLLDIERPLEL